MTIQKQQFQGSFADVMAITELRGAYPNVPIAPDVDYAALVDGDDSPQFLTIPIAKVNVTSRNQRYYDEDFALEIMRQTLANKPIGLMGHLSEAERATAFPKEGLHWVGAIRDADLIWGKAYLLGETRERVRRYKASGKSIATSIDAHAEGTWDESLGAYVMDAKTLRLGQIDLAPADRAGIPELAAIPLLTSEMDAAGGEAEPEQEPQMDKLQMIRELTVEDAALLPTPVKEAVIHSATPAPEIALVSELRQTLGVDDQADLKASVATLVTEQQQVRQQAIKSRILELATPDPTQTDNKGIQPAEVRAVVIEMVNARHPQTVDEATTFYNEVAGSQLVADLLKSSVKQTFGPNQRVPVPAQQAEGKYFHIPQGNE